jgi:hypothetical protein
MSYGRLNDEQQKALRPFVMGRVVHDLGAGDLKLARVLVQLGAEHVHAIDKHEWVGRPPSFRKITYRRAYFHDLDEPMDTIFLSWPSNYENPGLISHLSHCRTLIYLGKNTDGTMCGTPALFTHMVGRKLLAHVSDVMNTLIVTGDRLDTPRVPVSEEQAGIDIYGPVQDYFGRETRA